MTIAAPVPHSHLCDKDIILHVICQQVFGNYSVIQQ
jgi:hypothetical protein